MGRMDSGEPSDRRGATDGDAIFDELVRNELLLRSREGLLGGERRLDTDHLVDVVRHGPVLEALAREPLDRREIEAALDVSRATSHRFTRWLDDHGLVEKRDGRFHLTGKGQVVAEETLRFERNVAAADRLAPLLDLICDDHQELVVEPFADATVTVATPDDPYAPARRFVELATASATLRGFNTTHMVPLAMGAGYSHVLEETETEVIYLPDVVETLFETFPERAAAAVERGHLKLRTREALPYGLAIFDDRVGVGGYDEQTGAMRVFVDTDAAIAREWAERTYDVYRSRSTPIRSDDAA